MNVLFLILRIVILTSYILIDFIRYDNNHRHTITYYNALTMLCKRTGASHM